MPLVYASRRLASSPMNYMHAHAPLALQHVSVSMVLCLLISMIFNRVQTLGIGTNDQELSALLIMQATLPKRISVEGGTFKPYMRGVYMAYAFVCYCYFTVAICGYWAFGQAVQDNVLLSIRHPKWVVAVADMFVVVHVFGSYQVSKITVAHA